MISRQWNALEDRQVKRETIKEEKRDWSSRKAAICASLIEQASTEDLHMLPREWPHFCPLRAYNPGTLMAHWLHSFSRVAVTNQHKLGSLKLQKCILPQPWRTGARSQGVGSVMAPLTAPGENLFLPGSASGGGWHSLARGPTSALSTHCLLLCPSVISSCLSLLKTFVTPVSPHNPV